MENSSVADQIASLTIHRDTLKADIARRKKGDKSPGAQRVLSDQQNTLSEIEARLKELEPEDEKEKPAES